MTDLWNLKKFGDCANLIRDTIAPEAAQNVPYIGLEHIIEGGLTLSGYGFSDEVISAKNRFKKGDILFGKLRPYFRKVIIAPFDGVCSTDIWVVRAKTGTDQKFLFYWMASQEFVEEATRASEGTKMPRAKWEFVARIEKEIPPLPAQRTIAHILGSLDDQNEVNRKMNETLEAIAKAIFHSWFVDFDPVRAKAGCTQPEGMDVATAALFPSEFEEVEGREVPKGWLIRSLPEIFEINPQRSLEKDQIAPYLDMQNVSTQGHRPINWVERAFSSGTKFVNGDTLLARITPCLENGKTIFVDFLEEAQVGWGSTEYIVLRPKPPLPPEFGYLLARNEEFRAHAILNMSGTSGRQRVPSKCFDSYQIVIPTKAISEKFGENIRSLMARIKKNDEQSRILVSLRDALLPRLMNGDIIVQQN